MRALMAIVLGLAMVALGYNERGYWAFGGEAIIELICAVYVIVWIGSAIKMKLRGGKNV